MTYELKDILEAILFAADHPLTIKELRKLFIDASDEEMPEAVTAFRNISESQIAATLEELKIEHNMHTRGFQLLEVANGWRLLSRPEYAPWLKALLDKTRPHRLSQPALETLSIIALRQPISRAEIAAIRGVEVDGVVKMLLERDLITIVGRSNNPGKALLYGTTPKFLEHFGLKSIDDMPKAEELRLQAASLRASENNRSSEQETSENQIEIPDFDSKPQSATPPEN